MIFIKQCILFFEVREDINLEKYFKVFIILAFVDDLNEYSFSFGMYLPPMVRIKMKISSFI
jgi:hypothetical protein